MCTLEHYKLMHLLTSINCILTLVKDFCTLNYYLVFFQFLHMIIHLLCVQVYILICAIILSLLVLLVSLVIEISSISFPFSLLSSFYCNVSFLLRLFIAWQHLPTIFSFSISAFFFRIYLYCFLLNLYFFS